MTASKRKSSMLFRRDMVVANACTRRPNTSGTLRQLDRCIPQKSHKGHEARNRPPNGGRRLGRERAAESYARKRTFAACYNADVAVEAQAAFHGKARRDILTSQRTYRQYIVCYNDNLHFHVFSDHCTIHLCLGVFAIGLSSSR